MLFILVICCFVIPALSASQCRHVDYFFCSHYQSNNFTLYSDPARESEVRASFDPIALQASSLFVFIDPSVMSENCLRGLQTILCVSHFPPCDKSTGKTTNLCGENCYQYLEECNLEKSLDALFTERNTLFDSMKETAELLFKAAENQCLNLPRNSENQECDPYPEMIRTRQTPNIDFHKLPKNPDQNPERNLSSRLYESGTSGDQYELIRNWVLTWALLCFVSTSFTVLTFSVDQTRFQYPEKSIVFISLCYLVISVTYLVGYISGDRWTVQEGGQLVHGTSQLVHGTSVPGCVVTFAVQYYFLMASAIWWVIFGFTWFLAAGLKWCQEIIDNLWLLLHSVAWLVPAVKTVLIIAKGQVDGDRYTGVCFTGGDDLYLRAFLIVPLTIYLLTGFILLLSGFVSLFLIRREIRKEPNVSEKAERVIFRVGVFAIVYLIPATAYISALLSQSHCDSQSGDQSQSCARVGVLVVKYFMMFIPGTLSGFWLWTGKTVQGWSRFLASHRLLLISRDPKKHRTKPAVNATLSTTIATESHRELCIKPHITRDGKLIYPSFGSFV